MALCFAILVVDLVAGWDVGGVKYSVENSNENYKNIVSKNVVDVSIFGSIIEIVLEQKKLFRNQK